MTISLDMATALKIVPESPGAMLRKLAELEITVKGIRPYLTLMLQSGPPLTGTLLRRNREQDRGQGNAYSLLVPRSQSTDHGEIAVIAESAILGIVFHNAGDFAPFLSGGEVARPFGQLAPSKLELRRKLTEAGLKFQNDLGLSIEPDPSAFLDVGDALLNLRDVFESLDRVLSATARDTVGREAMNKIKRVLIVHAPDQAFTVQRAEAGELKLQVDLLRGLPQRLDQTLQDALNSAL